MKPFPDIILKRVTTDAFLVASSYRHFLGAALDSKSSIGGPKKIRKWQLTTEDLGAREHDNVAMQKN